MFTRKSLFVALTVLAMLAMVVPAAMAAPEVLSGLAITAPTTVNPKLIRTPFVDDPVTVDVVEGLDVSYVLTITGTQVNDVVATAWLENTYGAQVTPKTLDVNQAEDLVTGPNAETITIQVPPWLMVVRCRCLRS